MGDSNRIVAVFVAGTKHGNQELMTDAPDVLHVIDANGPAVFYEKRNTLRGGAADPAAIYVFYAPSGLPQGEYDALLKDARRSTTAKGRFARI